jgi:VWFA-related protein
MIDRGAPKLTTRFVLQLCLMAAAIAAAVAAQNPQQPIFRTGANLVRVDVTVIDRLGNPVNSLTADDFELVEDDVRQTIQTFKFVEATGQPPEGDDRSLAIRSKYDIEMEAARDDVRVVVIFWDEYYIDRMASAIRARRFLTQFVESEVAPLDLVAIVDEYTPADAIPFTRSKTQLLDQIRHLKGRRGIYTPPRNAAEEGHLSMGNIERLRTEVTVSALESIAVRLGGLREARKAIVFVSEGPYGLGRDWYSRLNELSRAANHANTAIYTVDPRGLSNLPASDILAEIAYNTNGRAILQSNAPERLLGQVFRHLSAYYLLGYESSQRPQDGKFHRIEVRVPRRRVDVLARKGYWAPSATDMEKARESAAASEAPTEVVKALGKLASTEVHDGDLWIGTARSADGGGEVTLAWARRKAPAATKGPQPVGLSVLATTSDGRTVFEGPASDGVVTFAAPPGHLKVRALYHDAAGERIGGETRELDVPDWSTATLALSTPVILRGTGPAGRRVFGPAPHPGREFVRTDRLMIRFEVYGAATATAEVSAKFLDRTGRVRSELAVSPGGGSGKYDIELPLSFAAPGDYLIALGVASGDGKIETLVPIRVLSRP